MAFSGWYRLSALSFLLATISIGWKVSASSQKTGGCVQEVNCRRPHCVCPSIKAPLGMQRRDTPQLVYFTFDDAVTDFTSRAFNTLFPPERTNPNGCPIPMTLFISHYSTNYNLVRAFYERGMELAVHSVNHKHIRSSDDMLYEAVQQRKNIAREAKVPIDKITGWRSPFLLPYGDKQIEILKNNGFEYDSTLTIDRAGLDGNTYWPLTMDYGWPYSCMVVPCPSSNFTGFWEIPIVSVMDYQKSFPCQYIDGCVQPPPDAEAAFQYLWQNFESYYRTSHAPFGINMHAAWFAWPERLAGMNRFIQELGKLDDVYIVTVQQLIQYMKNPVKLSQARSFPPFQCQKMGAPASVGRAVTQPRPKPTKPTRAYTTRTTRRTTMRPTTRRTTTRRTTTRRITTRRTTTRRTTTRRTTPRRTTTRRTTPRTTTTTPRPTTRTTIRTTRKTQTPMTVTKQTTTRRQTPMATARKTSRRTTPRTTTRTTARKLIRTTKKPTTLATTRPPYAPTSAADNRRYKTATPWWNLIDNPVTGKQWWQQTVSPSVVTSHPWWDSRRRTPYHRPTPKPTKPYRNRRTTTKRWSRYTTTRPTTTTHLAPIRQTTTRRFRLKLPEIVPNPTEKASWAYWTRHSVALPTLKPTSRTRTSHNPGNNREISQAAGFDPNFIAEADGTKRCQQGLNCFLPNCFCDGKQVPQTVSLKQTPQIVYITFEGPVNPQIYVEFVRLFSSRRRNPNGCPIKATFFVPSSTTDPGYTKTLYERGNEISLLAHSGDPMRQRDLLAVRTEIPKLDIKGWRSENLSPLSEGYYKSLPKHGFKYDSTLIDTRERKGEQLWPLTLDYGWTRQCNIKPCPLNSHPGIWEIPVVAQYDIHDRYPCTYMDGCHMQPGTTNDTYKLLWDNFQAYYSTNRAPYAINLRQTWFHYFYLFKLDALNQFIEKLLQMDDVYIVTITEMLEWIKDPVPLNELTNYQSWQCF